MCSTKRKLRAFQNFFPQSVPKSKYLLLIKKQFGKIHRKTLYVQKIYKKLRSIIYFMNRTIQTQLLSSNFSSRRTKKFQRSGFRSKQQKSVSSIKSVPSKLNVRDCFLPMPQVIMCQKKQVSLKKQQMNITCPYCHQFMIQGKNQKNASEFSYIKNAQVLRNQDHTNSKKRSEKRRENIKTEPPQDKGIIKLKNTLSKLKIEQLQCQNKNLLQEIKTLKDQLAHTQSLEQILIKNQNTINELTQKNIRLHHQYAFEQKSTLQQLNRARTDKDQAYEQMKKKYKKLMGQYMKIFKVNVKLMSKKQRIRTRDQDSTQFEQQSLLISEDDAINGPR